MRKKDYSKHAEKLACFFPPIQMMTPQNLPGIIMNYVMAPYMPETPFLNAKRPILTLGSCFAEHIASHLKKRHYQADHYLCSERLFTTHALRAFFDGLCTHTHDPALIDDLEKNRILLDSMHTTLQTGCTVILTLGLGISWFDKHTGNMVHNPFPRDKATAEARNQSFANPDMFKRYEMRLTSVEENAQNIRACIEHIKTLNTNNDIIISLSPIPLQACVSDHAFFVSDTLSKSTLRLAIEEVMHTAQHDVHYFPSYEVVRGVMPHFGSPWGKDGVSRHVNSDVIHLIMELFMLGYAEQAPEKAAADA